MNLVKVDHIDIEPAEAVLALAANGVSVQRAMDIPLFVPAQTALGENVRTRTGPIAQRGCHDFLRMAHSVNGRGVDPVNAQLERAMNRGDGSFVILFAPTKLQPDPPIAHAPKPIGVMNKSELPSCFV